MAIVELIMPKMGESIIEATIINWIKNVGDHIEEDETVLEVATDKVDSEVPSPISGRLTKILHQKDEVVAVGKALALIETDDNNQIEVPEKIVEQEPKEPSEISEIAQEELLIPDIQPLKIIAKSTGVSSGKNKFYTPLVRNIAKSENISFAEMDQIEGTGPNGRVTKEDLFHFVSLKKRNLNYSIPHPNVPQRVESSQTPISKISEDPPSEQNINVAQEPTSLGTSGDVEIIEMDRMRKLIAQHMMKSKQTSAHVSSFVEADVTHMVHWRNRVKEDYESKHGEKLTFSPLFVEAVIKALKDFPKINASLSGDNMIIKKNLNLGIATALPSGNLIVPVIKNCEDLNLMGLTKKLNDITARARINKLSPDEVKGGTFTISNIGTFGNIMGTPIINQPELAILALGTIKKKPVIMETDHGDIIAIRHMMFLSLSYDHRVIDGYLGGSFLKRIADYIEKFDPNREF